MPAMEWLPRPLAVDVMLTPRGGGFAGHEHGCDELCLVANEPSLIRHAGVERVAESGSLYLFRHGEFHGYRNPPRSEPHLWLIHFVPDPALETACPVLAATDPEQRVWQLDAEQQAWFRALFARVQHAHGQPAEAAAWLRLLLLALGRWREGDATPPPLQGMDADLTALWELIHEHIERPEDLSAAIHRRLHGYDALRHRFRRLHGEAPMTMAKRLRIERAKQLLLQSSMPVSAIAERLGYGRAQEFIRAFHREVGVAPAAWRGRLSP